MATLQTRCLLSIFLVNWLQCVSLREAPAGPGSPICHRPCDKTRCSSSDVHCHWSPSPRDQVLTNYSLHWRRPTGSEQKSLSNIIGRQHFQNGEELRVWVEAKTQGGSAKSPEVVLNTTAIYQPPPPVILQDPDEAFTICWESVCNRLDLIIGPCSVQYRTEDQDWREKEGFYSIYTIEEPQLCSAYDFRVRCACGGSLISDWSAILTTQGIEKSPEGELDVWRDCGPSHAYTRCILIWKRLPVSQTCGFILGYEITINSAKLKVSVSEPGSELNCSEVRCHFAVERSATVSVSAYNAHGATQPSVLKWLRSGTDENTPALHIDMNAENLTVSWKRSSELPDNLKAYVVQCKEIGSPPDQIFDWARLKRSQTSTLFRGRFKNYTAYQVSLFTLSITGDVHHISSAMGYSMQKVPARVPSFEVSFLGNRQVNLQWEPVPILQQYGLMQYYEIGVGELKTTYKVYNLSARTHKLEDLSPGQVYNVWIRAVNAAGPGENTARKVTTKEREDFDVVQVITIASVLILICVVCALGFLVKICLCKSKVPDPKNSQIFRERKHQTSDSVAWICILLREPNPTISLLEIVTSISPQDVTSDIEERSRDTSMLLCNRDTVQEVTVEEDSVRGGSVKEECGQKDNRCELEAYRKMVDSDEEDMNSSDEEQDLTGYERHFMPTDIDMLEVSSE